MHIKLVFWFRAIHLLLPISSVPHARAQFGVCEDRCVCVGVDGVYKLTQPTKRTDKNQLGWGLKFNFGFGFGG